MAVTVVLLLLAGGLGAGATYYVVGGRQATAAPNTVTSTSISTTTVNGGPSTGGATTAISIDAVQIYRESNQSVVTVDGFVSQTVNSFFGQVTRIGEVLGSGFVISNPALPPSAASHAERAPATSNCPAPSTGIFPEAHRCVRSPESLYDAL